MYKLEYALTFYIANHLFVPWTWLELGSKKSAFVDFYVVSIQFPCELMKVISRHFPYFNYVLVNSLKGIKVT